MSDRTRYRTKVIPKDKVAAHTARINGTSARRKIIQEYEPRASEPRAWAQYALFVSYSGRMYIHESGLYSEEQDAINAANSLEEDYVDRWVRGGASRPGQPPRIFVMRTVGVAYMTRDKNHVEGTAYEEFRNDRHTDD